MRSREWYEVVFPVTTVLLAGFVIQHFLLQQHGPQGPPARVPATPADPVASRATGGGWPPAGDSAALLGLALPRAVPFEIGSGVPEDSRVVVRVSGHLRLDRAGLLMSIDGQYNRIDPHPDYTASLRVESASLGIAAEGSTGWRLVEEGPSVAIGSGYQTLPAGLPIELQLPDVQAVDLANRWPVIRLVIHVDEPSHLDLERMSFYVHGDRELFAALLEPKPGDAERP